AESFVPPFRQVWAWEVRIPANWKVPTENTLEMYHLPCLHVKTFGRYLEEEHYTHVLGERSSSVLTTEYHAFITAVQNWMLRRLGVRPTNTYAHHLIHPHTVYIGMDSMRLAEQFVPVDAATTIQRVRLYAVQGFRRNPLARAVARMMRYFVRMITRRILTEDLVVFGQVQRGLAHSP